MYDGDYQSDCEFFTDVFVKNGVPADALVGEDKSGHTHDYAFLSRKVVDEKGIEIKTALIVSKAFLAQRCLMLYLELYSNREIVVSLAGREVPNDNKGRYILLSGTLRCSSR